MSTSRKRILTMSTDLKTTQRPVVFLCKCIGIISFSYTLGPDGLLIQNKNLKLYSFVEFMRLIALLIFTYNVQKRVLIPEKLGIFKFWIIIISARISEKWIVKYVCIILMIF